MSHGGLGVADVALHLIVERGELLVLLVLYRL